MLKLSLDEYGLLVLTTDEPNLHYFLEKKESTYQYLPWKKEWGYANKVVKIYEKEKNEISEGIYRYRVGAGWAAYVINALKDKISSSDYNGVIDELIMSDSYRTIPFEELRDYQNDDVLHLLKYRRGLFSCFTGYGKSQVISVLANYARSIGKKVLLVCPGTKARDELVKRCKTLFGLEVSSSDKKINGELDCLITSGLLNSGKVTDPDKKVQFDKILASYDWVLVDEVEYTINDAGKYLYDHCVSASVFYGFSGTADKFEGKQITFYEGLNDIVIRNKDLVKYFGQSLVFRLPLNKELNNIKIKTKALDDFRLDNDKVDKTGNIYMEIMNQIWTNKEICEVICKIIKHFPKIYIPMNNLVYVLSTWISDYWIGKFRILLIYSKGYKYYDLSGNEEMLTLDTACEYIKDDKIDVIASTSSGFRALDLPGLTNIGLWTTKIAGNTLQALGRISRGTEMNLITIEPINDSRKIPVYTKGLKERQEMIENCYKYCEIKNTIIYEDDLWRI